MALEKNGSIHVKEENQLQMDQDPQLKIKSCKRKKHRVHFKDSTVTVQEVQSM